MLKIKDFEMVDDKATFVVKNYRGSECVEIELLGLGHTTMTDIYEFDFLKCDEFEVVDRFVSVVSSMLMVNARRR